MARLYLYHLINGIFMSNMLILRNSLKLIYLKYYVSKIQVIKSINTKILYLKNLNNLVE